MPTRAYQYWTAQIHMASLRHDPGLRYEDRPWYHEDTTREWWGRHCRGQHVENLFYLDVPESAVRRLEQRWRLRVLRRRSQSRLWRIAWGLGFGNGPTRAEWEQIAELGEYHV